VKAFADSPKEAPVIHFDGPLTFALFDADGQAFARGEEASQLTVLIGTWGPDRGTFTTIPCDSVPADVHPVAEIVFPGGGPEGRPIKSKVVLTHRC
jgi:hypothetical protein